MNVEVRRPALALLISLLIHAFLLSLTFGGQDQGFPGIGLPWQERRVEVPLRVELNLTASSDSSAAAAIGAPAEAPHPQVALEPYGVAEVVELAKATPELASGSSVLIAQVVAIKAKEPEQGADTERSSLPLAGTPPARLQVSEQVEKVAPPVLSKRDVEHSTDAALPLPLPEAAKEPIPPIASSTRMPEPKIELPKSSDPEVLAPKRVKSEVPIQVDAVPEVEPEALETQRLAALSAQQDAQREAQRQQAQKQELARLEAEQLAAAQREVQRKEAIRQEAIRQEAVRQEVARQEVERREAARLESLRREAERVEMARKEAERQELARLAAAQLEAQRQQALRQELVRQELARQEATRIEMARQEASRLDALRREQARLEAERVELARIEAQRQEASRLAAAQQEARRQEAVRQEALRQDALRQEVARKEAIRQAAARQEAARLQEEREEDARRDARRKAMGRLLDEEAAQREAAQRDAAQRDAAQRDSPRAASSLPYSWSTARRVRLWGRTDPNVELVEYAEAWARKIQFNTPIDTVRDLAKRARANPMITVALRSDGTIETVTFVISSGDAAVDEEIRRIIQGNAPYNAFTPGLASQFDVIEIRRTWQFDTAIRLF